MFRIREITDRDPVFEAYAKSMAEAKKDIPKKPASTIQSASTQAILNRDKEEDKKRQSEINDPNYWNNLRERSKAQDPEEAMKDLLQRVKPSDLMHAQSIRDSNKNYLGCEEKPSTSEERRTKSIHAFTYSKPSPITEVQIEEIKKIEEIKLLTTVPKQTEVWKPLNPFQALIHWIKGGEVRRETKDEN